MRISDWSSDVCSSDLDRRMPALLIGHGLTWFSEWHELTGEASDYVLTMDSPRVIAPYQQEWVERYEKMFGEEPSLAPAGQQGYDYMTVGLKVLQEAGSLDYEKLVETARALAHQGRSEERREGTECASRCRFRWSPYN